MGLRYGVSKKHQSATKWIIPKFQMVDR